MTNGYIKLMDVLYFICVLIAGGALVIMSTIIAWGVFTRYVLGSGSFWPEPISIFLAIQLSFYGAAACYRAGTHISLKMFVDLLPPFLKRWQGHLVDLLMAAICLFMVTYGASLVKTTYFQAYPEFQYIRVGVAYSAIPIAGLITLLFVIEKVFIKPPINDPKGGDV
ncbi:MAG: TRAP transporter small permease [Desulfobacterales bacterium]|jgi:TRAP-type C4-dicarboxylate transport system permease small subunit